MGIYVGLQTMSGLGLGSYECNMCENKLTWVESLNPAAFENF